LRAQDNARPCVVRTLQVVKGVKDVATTVVIHAPAIARSDRRNA
jgi:hypothetical protein